MKKILEIKTIQFLTPTSYRPRSSPAARQTSPERTIENTFTESISQEGMLRGSKRVRRSLTKQEQRKKLSLPAEKSASRIHQNPEFRLSHEPPRQTRTRYDDHPDEKFRKTQSHSRYETKLSEH